MKQMQLQTGESGRFQEAQKTFEREELKVLVKDPRPQPNLAREVDLLLR